MNPSQRIGRLLLVWLLLSSWPSAAEDILGDQDSETTETAAADSAEMVSPEIPQLNISVRLDTPIIDGDLSDGFWHNLSDIPIQYEVFPVRLRASGVSTNVRIALAVPHLHAASNAAPGSPLGRHGRPRQPGARADARDQTQTALHQRLARSAG